MIEDIKAAIIRETNVDSIVFNIVDDPENVIMGRFERFTQRPTVYSEPEDRVTISIRSGMSEEQERYVLCKEMCHAFDADTSSHVSNFTELGELVKNLLVPTIGRELLAGSPPVFAEKQAEFLALEILCPLNERLHLTSVGRTPCQIAKIYKIPEASADIICNKLYTDAISTLFESDFNAET